MRNPMIPGTAIAVVALFIVFGLAGTAIADKGEPVDPKFHKEDAKHQYVNLGLVGDIGIFCGLLPGEAIPGLRPENFCLGGAVGAYDSADSTESWDVWIHDYVWNGCDLYTIPAQDAFCMVQPEMGSGVEGVAELAMETLTSQGWTVELKSAGLARTVTTYDLPPPEESGCVPIPPNTDPESDPRVCPPAEGPEGGLRNANTFGFCGQGSIDSASGMVDPFDTSGGPDGSSATDIVVEKQVFTDGLLFFQLDCPLAYGVTGNLQPFVTAVDSGCYTDKLGDNVPTSNTINLGTVALVGEIGWTHDATNTCKDEPAQDGWFSRGLKCVRETFGNSLQQAKMFLEKLGHQKVTINGVTWHIEVTMHFELCIPVAEIEIWVDKNGNGDQDEGEQVQQFKLDPRGPNSKSTIPIPFNGELYFFYVELGGIPVLEIWRDADGDQNKESTDERLFRFPPF